MSRTGENIADFLLAQQITAGLAIVEIKATTSPPFDARPFRGNLYGPNELLCAAMAQAFGTASVVDYDLCGLPYRSWRCQRKRCACLLPCDRWLHSGADQSDRKICFGMLRGDRRLSPLMTFGAGWIRATQMPTQSQDEVLDCLGRRLLSRTDECGGFSVLDTKQHPKRWHKALAVLRAKIDQDIAAVKQLKKQYEWNQAHPGEVYPHRVSHTYATWEHFCNAGQVLIATHHKSVARLSLGSYERGLALLNVICYLTDERGYAASVTDSEERLSYREMELTFRYGSRKR